MKAMCDLFYLNERVYNLISKYKYIIYQYPTNKYLLFSRYFFLSV